MSTVIVVRVADKHAGRVARLALEAAAKAGRRVRLFTEPCKKGVRVEVFGNKTGPDERAAKIIKHALEARGFDLRSKS